MHCKGTALSQLLLLLKLLYWQVKEQMFLLPPFNAALCPTTQTAWPQGLFLLTRTAQIETSLGYVIWVGAGGHAFPRKTPSVFVSPSTGEVYQFSYLRCIIPMAQGWIACWSMAGLNQVSWWTLDHLKPLLNHYEKCLAGGSFVCLFQERIGYVCLLLHQMQIIVENLILFSLTCHKISWLVLNRWQNKTQS